VYWCRRRRSVVDEISADEDRSRAAPVDGAVIFDRQVAGARPALWSNRVADATAGVSPIDMSYTLVAQVMTAAVPDGEAERVSRPATCRPDGFGSRDGLKVTPFSTTDPGSIVSQLRA
jgi:hypothetical protein